VNFIETFVIGVVLMTIFAATLDLPVQLFGALITGLTVGVLIRNEKKSALCGFTSGLLGKALAGAITGFTIEGVSGGLSGLAIGGALGIFFGTIAMVSSITIALISQRMLQ